jgi:hypothetical protein
VIVYIHGRFVVAPLIHPLTNAGLSSIFHKFLMVCLNKQHVGAGVIPLFKLAHSLALIVLFILANILALITFKQKPILVQ